MTSTRKIHTAGLVGLLLVAACNFDRLLRVESPSRIPGEILEVPGNASLLVTSAVGDFECAYGAYAVMSGLIGEELRDGTQTADRYPYDSRSTVPSDRRYSVFGCEALGVYTPLQTARASAENVLRLLNQWTDEQVPNRTNLIAIASAYAGYSLVLLGEGFCSMVVSSVDANRNFVYGGEIARDSVFKLAEARFTDAINAATTAEILNMALVGRARVRLDLGRPADAEADALLVPATFVENATASATTTRRQNRVWAQNSPTSDATAVGEPYITMSATDPRISLTDKGRKSVTGVELWQQNRYKSAGDTIVIARGDEARLIRAEADIALNPGDPTVADSIINRFRARGGQGAITSATSQAALDSLIDQRRREFFLDGHHLGDVLRYGITLQPPKGDPFQGGGVYGNQVCLPLPDVEKLNNPNF